MAGARAKLVAFVAIAIALGACDAPGVSLVDPQVVTDPERTITVTVRLEDPDLADAFGWGLGVPGATISYHRVHDESAVRTAETGSNGLLRLEDMLPGQYRFSAYRLLRDDETGSTEGRVRAFADGHILQVDPPQEVSLSLRGDRAESLVFSEVRYPGRYEGAGAWWPDYTWFAYFELYNNADTTVYLDGMLWGQGFILNRDGTTASCVETAPYRNDPSGIWAWYIHQFPGGGVIIP